MKTDPDSSSGSSNSGSEGSSAFDNNSSSSSSCSNSDSKSQDESDPNPASVDSAGKSNSSVDGEEKRTSRCMFCGEALVLSSEEDAVEHMRVCPALQEQLASPDQFTIPTMLREENNL